MTKQRLCFIVALLTAIALPIQGLAENVSTSGVTSNVYDIPTGDFIAESLDDLKMLVDNTEGLDLEESSVLTVVVPSNLDFHLDPLELNNRGQIYSDNFLIENYSNTDVTVKLENIKYTFINETDFISLDSPPEIPFGPKNPSKFKEVYMLLHYENRNYEDFAITTKERSETADIILSAAEYDEEGNFVGLKDGSTLLFNFTGIVNHMAPMEWKNKDFSVSIEYTLIPNEPSENDEVIDESEEDESDSDMESNSAEASSFGIENSGAENDVQNTPEPEAEDIPPVVQPSEIEPDSPDSTSVHESSNPVEDEPEDDLNPDEESGDEDQSLGESQDSQQGT